MQSHKPVAALHNVTKTIRGEQIVKGVSLAVAAGEMVLVTGPSASGKSTCIRMFADLETPTTGHVEAFGVNYQDVSQRQRRAVIAQNIAITSQKLGLSENRTAWENMTGLSLSIARERSRAQIAARAGQVAIALDIDHLLDRPAQLLSGGEKCRVAIGRSLVTEPKLLLLDESTTYVDPAGTEKIYETLTAYKEQEDMAMLIIAHDVDQARPFADREVTIAGGRVID